MTKSKDELQKIAVPYFDKFSKTELYGTSDGQVFIESRRAKEHADKNKLALHILLKEEEVSLDATEPLVPETPTVEDTKPVEDAPTPEAPAESVQESNDTVAAIEPLVPEALTVEDTKLVEEVPTAEAPVESVQESNDPIALMAPVARGTKAKAKKS